MRGKGHASHPITTQDVDRGDCYANIFQALAHLLPGRERAYAPISSTARKWIIHCGPDILSRRAVEMRVLITRKSKIFQGVLKTHTNIRSARTKRPGLDGPTSKGSILGSTYLVDEGTSISIADNSTEYFLFHRCGVFPLECWVTRNPCFPHTAASPFIPRLLTADIPLP